MTTDAPGPSPPVTEGTASGGLPQLGFLLGSALYSVPLTRLREVSKLERLRRIPGAAAHVAGLVNVRGEIICALDTRAILGLPRSSNGDHGFLIALRDFDFPVGLIVDSIADVFSIEPSSIEPPPDDVPAERAAFLTGVCAVSAGSMGLIDLDRVVNR